MILAPRQLFFFLLFYYYYYYFIFLVKQVPIRNREYHLVYDMKKTKTKMEWLKIRFPVPLLLSICIPARGAGRSSEVERSLMVRWVVGSILHGVDPLSYFSFQPVLHDWYNKGRGMCYPVCGMVHIKEPLLLIGKSSPCGGSGFPLSLSEWSLTICLTPNNRR